MIYGNFASGLCGIHIGRRYVCLKAPWRMALFSERYRQGVRVIPLLKGWRITVRTKKEPRS